MKWEKVSDFLQIHRDFSYLVIDTSSEHVDFYIGGEVVRIWCYDVNGNFDDFLRKIKDTGYYSGVLLKENCDKENMFHFELAGLFGKVALCEGHDLILRNFALDREGQLKIDERRHNVGIAERINYIRFRRIESNEHKLVVPYPQLIKGVKEDRQLGLF